MANGVSWSSSTVDGELSPSHPTTPSAGGAEKDSNSPGFGVSADAADTNPEVADYRRMACDAGSSSALCRPYTAANAGARVSIYAPAPALKKHIASPKHSTADRSPRDQSSSSPRMLTDDTCAALRTHSQAPATVRAASSHGTPGFPTPAAVHAIVLMSSRDVLPGVPSPRGRIISGAAAAVKCAGLGADRPKSSPSAVASAVERAAVRSFTADPAFQAAAAALAAAAQRNRKLTPRTIAPKSRESTIASGGGRASEETKPKCTSSAAADAAAPPSPVATPLPQGPSSATQSVAAAKSL